MSQNSVILVLEKLSDVCCLYIHKNLWRRNNSLFYQWHIWKLYEKVKGTELETVLYLVQMYLCASELFHILFLDSNLIWL